MPIATGDGRGENLNVSISIGVCFACGGNLDYLTKKADEVCIEQSKTAETGWSLYGISSNNEAGQITKDS